MSKKNKGGGNKLNNIKPGTICELIKNDCVMFRITHVNDCGYPFSDLSVHTNMGYDGLTEGNHCVAYTDMYKECSLKRKKQFFEYVYKCRCEREENLFKIYEDVRASGEYNMIMDMNTVLEETGMNKDDYLWVIDNYSELKKKYAK